MKIYLQIILILFLSLSYSLAQTDCISVSYKNNKKNEKGIILFCFGNSNTLMVNNYNVDDNELISALLLTPNGVEMKQSDPSWKKEMKPLVSMPSENSKDFQGYKLQYAKLTDGSQTVEIWFTKEIKFFNSQNYWLFLGGLGMQIQEKYSDLFPVAMRLMDDSGKVVYEHALIEKTNIKTNPDTFKGR